ncbi:zinc carboxypeptidase [Opisthorchis viverrini]|uniref:Zinc carboxypeptidase n=1 Tax=Opisthorchis viverrini TaxID=6198 RepID=A0A1S8XAN4_OPIVI|nr:zinc carboxypeptidase [Opisthorchis viverrini]
MDKDCGKLKGDQPTFVNSEISYVGNVSRDSIHILDGNRQIRKDSLIFDACFESGNLAKVECISEFEFDLHIRADTCNPKFRVWFNFKVSNCCANQRVIFNVVNFSKTKSLYREGMSPLVRSTSRPQSRIPHKNVFYYRCPEHRRNYVMSFAFCFDREEEYQFCYCYPYTFTRLQAYLDEIDKKAYAHYRREFLGSTLQQRRIDLLTITHPKNLQETSSRKQRIIFVTARVHPGETPSSYVCQDFMVSEHPIAQELRKHLVFKIVPMLNPDGVYLGNYRCSLMGFDLNRQWQNPSQWAHPEIFATKELLMQLDQSTTMDVNFFIDIHAHSTLLNGFMYGNVFEDEERAGRQAVFPNLLSQFAEDFSLPQTNFNCDAVKADARLGRNLARTFHEYYAKQGLFKRSVSSLCMQGLRDLSESPHSMGDVADDLVQQRRSTVRDRGQAVEGYGDHLNTKNGHSASPRNQAVCQENQLVVKPEQSVIEQITSNKSTTKNSQIHDRKKEVMNLQCENRELSSNGSNPISDGSQSS